MPEDMPPVPIEQLKRNACDAVLHYVKTAKENIDYPEMYSLAISQLQTAVQELVDLTE